MDPVQEDEPFRFLDAAAKEKIERKLREEKRRRVFLVIEQKKRA
jgi:ABC-type sulfate/molybdate transport systems ATPase subunit